ncbi:MAG: RNA polymerase sigma factor [Spirochaetes bacterium]|nr:RNA polymerase sigma factor [Spirochaetota bacterium]
MNAQGARADIRDRVEAAYHERKGSLLTAARRMTRNAQDAEDVLQDVFAGALTNLDALSAVENIPGWLFATLRNRLTDLWRRTTARRRAGEIAVSGDTLSEIAVAVGLSPEDHVVMMELSDALADAIGALPSEQREVIEAQALEGIGFRELSERSGVSINTLTARKKYAIEKLARVLKDWAESD